MRDRRRSRRSLQADFVLEPEAKAIRAGLGRPFDLGEGREVFAADRPLGNDDLAGRVYDVVVDLGDRAALVGRQLPVGAELR